jgi:hypothetical protein
VIVPGDLVKDDKRNAVLINGNVHVFVHMNAQTTVSAVHSWLEWDIGLVIACDGDYDGTAQVLCCSSGAKEFPLKFLVRTW